LNNSGIHLNDKGAIYVNPYQETNIKNIYAAGDCATNYHLIKKVNDYIPLGTTANKQGRIAGANMAGQALTVKGIVGTSIIKFFDLTLGRTGLTETEAKSLKMPYKVQTTKAKTIAGDHPGGQQMTIKIIYQEK